MRDIQLGAIYTTVEQRKFTSAKNGKWARMLAQEGASYEIVNMLNPINRKEGKGMIT